MITFQNSSGSLKNNSALEEIPTILSYGVGWYKEIRDFYYSGPSKYVMTESIYAFLSKMAYSKESNEHTLAQGDGSKGRCNINSVNTVRI